MLLIEQMIFQKEFQVNPILTLLILVGESNLLLILFEKPQKKKLSKRFESWFGLVVRALDSEIQ